MRFVAGAVKYDIGEHCLETFLENRQKTLFAKETGGQLFARFTDTVIFVESATITKGRSKRSRFGFFPDERTERREIEERFRMGFHYVGDWHTHPEYVPEPSLIDEKRIINVFTKTIHALDGILLITVGLSPFPEGSHVGVTNGLHVERSPS